MRHFDEILWTLFSKIQDVGNFFKLKVSVWVFCGELNRE